MKVNKLIIALVAILVVLLIIAASATFLTNNGQIQPAQAKGNASIAVTGDIMFARNMAGVLSMDKSPFAGVSNVSSNVDLLIINFENAATNSENAVKGDVPLKCDPSYVPLAKANNNTIATLANNHVCDYGIDGMHDTIKYLNDAGITTVGAGDNEDDAHKAVSKDINGRNITVLNYMDSNNFAEYSYEALPYANGSSPGYSAYDSADAQKQISDARGNGSDFVVAYLHFGNEYSTSPNEDQLKIAHELVDYGADIVIGSHPHVTQGVEMYKGKPIFYSLGNCVFDMSGNGVENAYILKIDLVNNTGKCTVYPIYISNYLPQFMGEDEGNSLLNGLTPKCNEFKVANGVGTLDFNLTEK